MDSLQKYDCQKMMPSDKWNKEHIQFYSLE